MGATCDLYESATQRFHPFHSQLYLGKGRAVYCGPLQDSGFADATHYSHAFRDTFGVNPAPVFRKIERFERLA